MIEAHFINISRVIAKEIDRAKKSIHIAMYFFTNKLLFEKLLQKADNGVEISLIIHDNYINLREGGIEFQKLADKDGTSIYISSKENPIHDKFCIIDDCTLISGSYNWTLFAENKNEENIMLLQKEDSEQSSNSSINDIITSYMSEYKRLTSTLTPIKNIPVYTRNEIDEYYTMDGKEYLMHDMIFEAAGLENKERASKLAQEAIALNPENIKVQIQAAELKLIPRKRLEHSIGIQLIDDKFLVLIKRGSFLPIENVGHTRNAKDDQTTLSSYLYYGEDPIASQNTPLVKKVDNNPEHLRTVIYGLEKRPKGEVVFMHTFNIGFDGVLHIKTLPTNSKWADYVIDPKTNKRHDTIMSIELNLNEINGMISDVMENPTEEIPF